MHVCYLTFLSTYEPVVLLFLPRYQEDVVEFQSLNLFPQGR